MEPQKNPMEALKAMMDPNSQKIRNLLSLADILKEVKDHRFDRVVKRLMGLMDLDCDENVKEEVKDFSRKV